MKTHPTKKLIATATASLAILAALLVTQSASAQSASKQKPAPSRAPSQADIDKRVDAAASAYQSGSYSDAIKLFREVVQLNPRHALAWHFLGQSLAKADDPEGARQAYEQVLEIQPTGKIADSTRKALNVLTLNTTADDPFQYYLQVGTFRGSDDAEAQKRKLAEMGLSATVSERTQSDMTLYRVRLGPYVRKAALENVKNKLELSGFQSATVRIQK